MVEAIWKNMAHPNDLHAMLMYMLDSTLMANIIYRALGAEIGARSLVVCGNTTDACSVRMGEDCVVTSSADQLHSFEDRVLKKHAIDVGDRVTLLNRATLFFGAKVGNDVTILPNSVVMKNEELMPNATYAGVPNEMIPEEFAPRRRELAPPPPPIPSQSRTCTLNARYKRGCFA